MERIVDSSCRNFLPSTNSYKQEIWANAHETCESL